MFDDTTSLWIMIAIWIILLDTCVRAGIDISNAIF